MNDLVEFHPGTWSLLITLGNRGEEILLLAMKFAEQGPLKIFDGGRQLDTRAMKRLTGWQPGLLDHIHISRTSNCFQLTSTLETMRSSPWPILITDFLNAFYTDNVILYDRMRLLNRCLAQFDVLCHLSGLIVTTGLPNNFAKDHFDLLYALIAKTPRVIILDNPVFPPVEKKQ